MVSATSDGNESWVTLFPHNDDGSTETSNGSTYTTLVHGSTNDLSVRVDQWRFVHARGSRVALDVRLHSHSNADVQVRDINDRVSIALGDATIFISRDQAKALISGLMSIVEPF